MPGNITYGKPSYKHESFVLDQGLFECRSLVRVFTSMLDLCDSHLHARRNLIGEQMI